MKKTIITIAIILLALVTIGIVLNNNKKENAEKTAIVAQKNASVSVKTQTVKTELVSLDFSVNGNFEPTQELMMTAERSGKVVKVLAKEGDRVTAGQTLAIMRGDIIGVENQTAQAAYQTALTDYKRFESAYQTGGVTKQQLDQAKMMLVNAQSRLKQANISLGDTRIKAPISGIINKKMIEVGTILAAMPPTTMFEIVNVSRLKLNINVDESQVAQLKIGEKVNITTSIYPDKKFVGTITFIAAKADSSLNFPVEIEIINNSNNDLKAGMYGTALFDSHQQQKSLMVVPRNAFVGSVESNQVFVVENGKAVLKTVTAGRIIGDKVEIINGLKNGDQVITTGQINLQNGTTVEIIK